MGIPPEQITDAMLELDTTGSLRKLRALKVGNPKAGKTYAETLASHLRRLEREEQRTLAGWLRLQQEAGILMYDWSSTHRRVTCRPGMPDFKIYRGGRALLGEMKVHGGRLSDDQKKMHDLFLRSGTEVEIWMSADVAIRRVRAWLWEHWRLWNEGEPGK